jgi:DNA-directed RNA polymerase subunit L
LLNEDYNDYVSDLEQDMKLLKFESKFTNTIFEPLKRSIFDITKNQVPLFYYEYVSNEHISKITVKDQNPLELLRAGINNIIKIITNILKEFN